jgi:hypothetical protein
LNRRLLALIGIAVFAPGCNLLQNSTRTLIVEPLHYCNVIQEHRARVDFRATAREVWEEYLEANNDESFSTDYADGFQEGFADYLYAGGTGEPPPVPPRKYWKNKFATPQGRQAIQDWFAGFRHGAGAAQLSGCRCLIEVPSSVPDVNTTPWQTDGNMIGPIYEPVHTPDPDSLSQNGNPAPFFERRKPSVPEAIPPAESVWSIDQVWLASNTVARAAFVPNELPAQDSTKSAAARTVRLPPTAR